MGVRPDRDEQRAARADRRLEESAVLVEAAPLLLRDEVVGVALGRVPDLDDLLELGVARGADLDHARRVADRMRASSEVAMANEPRASRPHMPEYGLEPAHGGEGLLPFGWAVERLQRCRNFWLSTVRADGLKGQKLLWVQPLDGALAPEGAAQVMCDVAGSGPGDTVFWVGGREAALALHPSFVPVDATVLGHVETSSSALPAGGRG